MVHRQDAHARRPKPPRSIIPRLRRKELQRLFLFRWGPTLPDDDAGRDDATVMAHTIAQFPGDASHHIEMFLEVAAPWMTRQDVAAVLATVLAKPLRFRADTLGARLGLREVERSRLRIRTIGAIDLTKAERLARRRDRKRVRRIGCRRAQGIRPRAVYEATSASRTKPWEAQGISRRTWERRGRPRLTQV
jgi:hypothetical protein